ncbi:hypothetical protein LSM04_005474 [Trypanosoma melophagium]|uniref:uncharacterized protein n=1 Tax=Trypanosoma melophagium TaxID=715481 RepID=UPI00351A060C|nr:hypothetical protein LSM04_005474 [Trypanosoma melophagium]
MKRILQRCQRQIGVTLTIRYSSNISSYRCVHSPDDGNSQNSTCMDGKKPLTSSNTSTVVTLNGLSSAVRRFFLKSPDRWWETPGSVETLITIILNNRQSVGNGNDGGLHPLLGVEILKGLGCAVWIDSDGGLGGWAVRSGQTTETLCKLAACVVQPMLPLIATHTRVKPLLPVIIEWLICISDIPIQMWVAHLTLYVNYLSTSKIADGVSYYCKGPPPDFLLFYLVKRISHLKEVNISTSVSEELRQIFDKMLLLLLLLPKQEVKQDDFSLSVESTSSYESSSYAGNIDHLAKCLFWKGEVPLLLDDTICEAYKRLCQTKVDTKDRIRLVSTHIKGEYLPLLSLSITSDDEFRRLLLRLSASSHIVKIKSHEGSSNHQVVLIEPLLQIEDPLVILRFISPLSEFVAEMIDSENYTHDGILSPMRLSFDGIKFVIYNAIGALHHLQKNRRSNRYVLLPHKPRIHTLKSLCEKLLNHLQRYEKEEDQQKHNNLLLFPGIPVTQQIFIISSFHRAARRLVAAVMSEKTKSLLEEGSEGSVLHAGGAMPKNNDVTSVLRNIAFRVLEVSLLRYYKAINALSFFPNEGYNEGEDVIRSKEEIEHHAGGRAMLFTVRHLLQHPLCQDVTAVVEGLRLVAIQSLVLHSPECEEWLRESYNVTIANAFFSVWHRTIGDGLKEIAGNSNITLVGESKKEEEGKGESHTTVQEVQIHMRKRLLWIMLLLHQRYCYCSTSSQEEPLITDKRTGFNCSLFRSMLDLLTSYGNCTEFTGFGWPLPYQEINITCTVNETKRSLNDVLWSRQLVYPPIQGGENAGYTSRWEMQEELSSLDCKGIGRWRWLGTTTAVSEAADFAKSEMDAGRSIDYAGYLLPWSTVVQSRHPLRLYDESGESTASALKFDVNVEKLLSLENGLVVRLVSIAEETMVFPDMMYTAELQLGGGVAVVHPEAYQLKQLGNLLHLKHTPENNADGYDDNGEGDEEDDKLD